VIVASILLALAADAWWDGVQDRRDQREAVSLLRADLSSDSLQLTGLTRTIATRDSAAAWFLRNRTRPDPPPDSVRLMVARIYTLDRYPRPRAAYLTLRDSGRLDLIRDDEIRVALVQYFEQVQVQLVQQFSDWLAVREHVITQLNPHARPSAPSSLRSTGPREYDPNWAWDEIRADDELMMLLIRYGGLASDIAAQADGQRAVTGRLSAALE